MLIVDASVAISAFGTSPLTEPARQVLSAALPRAAPDIFPGECANALAKLVRVQTIRPEAARSAFMDIRTMVYDLLPSSDLVPEALSTALTLNHGVFDCIYLETARKLSARLITTDLAFIRKLEGRADEHLVLHLSDWRP
jgi:predicted nucleic acid-binding protein